MSIISFIDFLHNIESTSYFNFKSELLSFLIIFRLFYKLMINPYKLWFITILL